MAIVPASISAAIATPSANIDAPAIAGEQRIAIHGVSFAFYKRFCEEIGEQPIRLSFNEGCLEIMITKSSHEYFKKLLAKMVEATVLELEIPVRSGGSMTFQRDDLEKGFEPDECWWIANELVVRTTTEFNFERDPPPDLAIEIEISHSLAKRIKIYAAIKVPEVWRFNGRQLRFCILGQDGKYYDAEKSMAFPFLSADDLLPFLSLPNETDETTRIREFMRWLRQEVPKP